MGRPKNCIYPVGISLYRKIGKFRAQFWDVRTKHNKVVGDYDTIEEAVKARNSFIKTLNQLGGMVKPIDRKLPKGVMKISGKKMDKYKAEVCFCHGKNNEKITTIYIGTFTTPELAKTARTKFINKLM